MTVTDILPYLSGPTSALFVLLFYSASFYRGWIVRGSDYEAVRAERDKARDALDKERAERLADAQDAGMLAKAYLKLRAREEDAQ